MITGIRIKNFKAIEDFEIGHLPRIVCLIGLNGAGKSSLLQALDFIATSFMGSDRFRDWKEAEIINVKAKKRVLSFALDLKLQDGNAVTWSGDFSVGEWRFISERVEDSKGNSILQFDGKTLQMGTAPVDMRDSAHLGSVFSTRKFEASPILKEVKDTIVGLKSLELLSPEELRRGSRSVEEISLGGAGLPGFIRTLERKGCKGALITDLKKFYPQIREIVQKKPGPGWFGFAIKELYGAEYETGMKHLNDGFLRILAIVSQKYSDNKTILFDEIENGINQELVESLVNYLLGNFADKQVFITTHSALVLNYFNDELVRDGVIFLYRTQQGDVRGVKFFELPKISEKLSYLNAGQVMADTDLVGLSKELSA